MLLGETFHLTIRKIWNSDSNNNIEKRSSTQEIDMLNSVTRKRIYQ